LSAFLPRFVLKFFSNQSINGKNRVRFQYFLEFVLDSKNCVDIVNMADRQAVGIVGSSIYVSQITTAPDSDLLSGSALLRVHSLVRGSKHSTSVIVILAL